MLFMGSQFVDYKSPKQLPEMDPSKISQYIVIAISMAYLMQSKEWKPKHLLEQS